MAVRLFIGNLPYGASEADLRAHFAAVAEPSHVAMPVDRETGRPRGFAFVEFAERAVAEEVIRKFDSQPFQGRPLAVSEARAREDRPPAATWRWLRASARRRWRVWRSPSEWRWRIWRSAPVRWRWLRRSTPRAWWPTARSRRSGSKRQLRTSGASSSIARKENHATGTQASWSDQGADWRTYLRRRRSRRRLDGRDRRRRNEGRRGPSDDQDEE